jgi:hypothetical protein
MPSDDQSSPPAGSARLSRGVRAFFRKMRKDLAGRGAPGLAETSRPADPALVHEVDMVDQAEAFQTLRVADVMTPRADIVAVEVSARSRRWWPSSPRPSIRGCRSIARRWTTRWGWSTSRTCSACWPTTTSARVRRPDPAPAAARGAVRARLDAGRRPAAAHAHQPHPHGPGHRRVRRHRRPGDHGGPDRGGGRRDRRRARRRPGLQHRRPSRRPVRGRRPRAAGRPGGRPRPRPGPAGHGRGHRHRRRPGRGPGRPRAAAGRGDRPSRRLRPGGRRGRSAPRAPGAGAPGRRSRGRAADPPGRVAAS